MTQPKTDEELVKQFTGIFSIAVFRRERDAKNAMEAFFNAINQARAEENLAWRNGERCGDCGKPMEPTVLADTCWHCLENN